MGFAAESQNVEDYARSKLAKKKLDMVAANDITAEGLGFNSDKNALHVYGKMVINDYLQPVKAS